MYKLINNTTMLSKCLLHESLSSPNAFKLFLRYKQKLSRNPIAVLTEDAKDFADESLGIEKAAPVPKPIIQTQKKKKSNKSRSTTSEPKDEFGFLRTVSQITKAKMKGGEEENQWVMLETERCILDAYDAGSTFDKIYVTRDKNLASSHPRLHQMVTDAKIPVVKVTQEDMKIATNVVTPSGIFGVCKKPDVRDIEAKRDLTKMIPVTLVAYNFGDPGNMGSLIRSAAAAGAERVVCSKECVNIWSRKVVRSAVASHFRIPVIQSSKEENLIMNFLTTGRRVFYAEMMDPENPGESYHQKNYFLTPEDKVTLVIGGEAFGYSPEIKKILQENSAQKVSIDMSLGVESLNNHVSASIILFEMKRQYELMTKKSSDT